MFGFISKFVILFLRFMNAREYLTLNSLSDVVLDTFPVGGGRSSFEIFSVATPIVLLYPRTSILQLTTGMYKTMGFFDQDDMPHDHVITHTEESFVKAAVEMANNSTIRERVQRLIALNNVRLYTPPAPSEDDRSGAVAGRWEPDSLEGVVKYFNYDHNQVEAGMFHSREIIKEWNKLLLFLGSCGENDDKSNDEISRRGSDYKQALSLQEDIKFRLSSFDGQGRLEMIVDYGALHAVG